MAITKINTPELLDINTTGAKQLPSGTTAQRPTTGLTAGDFRYNTTDNRVEYYDGTSPYDAAKWFQIDDEALPATCTTDTINYPTGTTNTAYYKMSDATDSTLNGYNGTATSVDFNVQGKFGNAGEFNGSSSVIDISASAGFPSSVYTVSMWLNINDVTAYQGFFLNVSSSNLTNQIGVVLNSGRIDIYSVVSNNNNTLDKIETTPQTAFVNNTWYNVVIIADRSLTNKVQVFVNNTENTYNYAPNSSGTTGYSTAKIGFADGNYFNGSIDQIRIFSTALTAANVTSLYNEVQCVPAIIPSDYFNPLLYTGNNNTQSIDDLTFAPDLVWIKSRSNGTSHELNDSVRGQVSRLFSDNTDAQGTIANGFVSLDSNGFSLNNAGNGGEVNGLNRTYVAWNWKAAATTTTIAANTVGNTIASDVRASTESGFSIVKYTGNGSTTATIATGLDKKVELVLIKNIDQSTVWSAVQLPEEKVGNLNNTNAMTFSYYLQSTTSSVLGFTAQNNAWNQSLSNHIAYCFASIPGFSDIGSYIGLGSSANPVIVTGFRPAFVMIKNTTTGATSWVMADNRRGYADLYANDASAEFASGSSYGAHFLSNGFTTNTFDVSRNASGQTYIYLAIAEQVYNANAVTANQTNPFNDGSQIAQYEFEDNADDSQPNGYIGKGGTFKTSQGNIILPVGVYNNAAAGASVSFWMKSGGTSYETPIYTRTGSAAAGWHIRTSTGGNGINWGWQNTSGSGVFASGEESFTFTDGWHHVVAIWDGTTSTNGAKLYIDGSLFDELTANATLASQTFTLGPTLGADRQSSGRSILGLDQVRIYNTALNPNDAWLLYSETSATSSTLDYPASKGAIALYELEGDATNTGSSTYDGAATAVAWVPLYDGTENSMTYAAPSVSTPFLKAGVFNGSSSYIDTNTKFTPTLMSFSAWVNPTVGNVYGAVISNRASAPNYYGIEFGINNNSRIYSRFSSSSGSGNSGTDTVSLPVGTWTQIGFTISGSEAKVYKNGALEYTVSIGTIPNTLDFHIGKQSGSSSTYFNGLIDQVRIFNKALDSGEVLQLYNEPNN